MVLPSPEVEAFLSALPRVPSGCSSQSGGATTHPSTSFTPQPAPSPAVLTASQPIRPTVTVAWAQTINGVIGTFDKNPIAISSQESMRLTHAIRARHEAILVGVGTVVKDDPRLTTRLWDGPDPIPVVLDRSLRTPVTAALFDRTSQPPIIFYDRYCDVDSRIDALQRAGARVIPGDPFDIANVLTRLHEVGIGSVMVEGGARILRSVLAGSWIDTVIATIAPRLLGGYSLNAAAAAAAAANANAPDDEVPGLNLTLTDPVYAQFGPDLVVGGTPRWR